MIKFTLIPLVAAITGLLSLSYNGDNGAKTNPTITFAQHGTKLLFSTGRDSDSLYSLDLKSLSPDIYCNKPGFNIDPFYNPLDETIVFASSANPNDSTHIWRYDKRAKYLAQLTTGTGIEDQFPTVTPDGRSILFVRAALLRPYSMGGMTSDKWDVWEMKYNGSGLHRISNLQCRFMSSPQLTSNGKSIISAGGIGNSDYIYQISRVNGSVHKLTPLGHAYESRLSPSGKHIVYISDLKVHFDYEVWIMDLDGAHQRQVTNMHSYLSYPIFSPDSRQIWFLSDARRASHFSLWKIDISGHNLKMVAGPLLFSDTKRYKPVKEAHPRPKTGVKSR